MRPHEGHDHRRRAATCSPRTSSGRWPPSTGVRAGNVIAFGVEGRRGREAIVVVAETKADDPSALRQAVAVRRCCDAVGVAADEVVLVAPGSLPKTSSGKLQRALCRSRYLGAELEMV